MMRITQALQEDDNKLKNKFVNEDVVLAKLLRVGARAIGT